MRPWGAIFVACTLTAGVEVSHARELTFEQRVTAQRAIEQTYWNHRVWPKENPRPKPPLSSVLTDDALRARVDDYLRKSNALEAWWHRPVTPEQLQAELTRMSQDTRDPQILRELHAALGNDAFVIAETLARPTLVERSIRSWYASDDRIHGALRDRARRALDRFPSVFQMKSLGGEYAEHRIVRGHGGGGMPKAAAGAIELDAGEWLAWREDAAKRFRSPADAIPTRQISALDEDADGLSVSAVLSSTPDEVVVATVTWLKRTFDDWWLGERERMSSMVTLSGGAYAIATPAGGTCADDTWEQKFYSPSARYGHSAVWTGSEMIIWGGFNSPLFLSSGGRYRPATDSWTETARTGAPIGRMGHKAVWTGTEMIVWGGMTDTRWGRAGRTTR